MLQQDGDGLFEAAVAQVQVQVLVAGDYSLVGVLEKDGRAVSHRPSWESAGESLAFSGEEIFLSGKDGPYHLVLRRYPRRSRSTSADP